MKSFIQFLLERVQGNFKDFYVDYFKTKGSKRSRVLVVMVPLKLDGQHSVLDLCEKTKFKKTYEIRFLIYVNKSNMTGYFLAWNSEYDHSAMTASIQGYANEELSSLVTEFSSRFKDWLNAKNKKDVELIKDMVTTLDTVNTISLGIGTMSTRDLIKRCQGWLAQYGVTESGELRPKLIDSLLNELEMTHEILSANEMSMLKKLNPLYKNIYDLDKKLSLGYSISNIPNELVFSGAYEYGRVKSFLRHSLMMTLFGDYKKEDSLGNKILSMKDYKSILSNAASRRE